MDENEDEATTYNPYFTLDHVIRNCGIDANIYIKAKIVNIGGEKFIKIKENMCKKLL